MLNVATMVKNLAHAVLYGQEKYKGLGVKNPFFLEEVIYIMALFNMSVCNKLTDQLLRTNAEAFRVKICIPFSITGITYNSKTFAYYMTNGWYKSFRKFTSKLVYELEILEDYGDLPLLREKDVYPMQLFVDKGYKSLDIKCFNFVWKHIQAVTLAGIATVDGNRISHQFFEGQAGNGLRVNV